MRVIIQRVKEASVTIDGFIKSQISMGLLILVGIEEADTNEDITWLCAKIANLRIFSDEAGLMNVSVMDRPSFIKAAKPPFAIPTYEKFVEELHKVSSLTVLTGAFGADMKVALLNDGPVTIFIDSKNRE
jgi:D-aminoacyl-tRNA deacylase